MCGFDCHCGVEVCTACAHLSRGSRPEPPARHTSASSLWRATSLMRACAARGRRTGFVARVRAMTLPAAMSMCLSSAKHCERKAAPLLEYMLVATWNMSTFAVLCSFQFRVRVRAVRPLFLKLTLHSCAPHCPPSSHATRPANEAVSQLTRRPPGPSEPDAKHAMRRATHLDALCAPTHSGPRPRI